ncbi:ribonuclease HI, partial [Methylorubrum thiocyanatum]|uniref:ribonuclease HI n=1 Tax=Methylorubrum thiocyanatum TaxID=47958 RepID=UPI003647D35B
MTREITIAFDGACRGNPGPGGYGAILINTRTGTEKIVKGREASTTNNRMELISLKNSSAAEIGARAGRALVPGPGVPCRSSR